MKYLSNQKILTVSLIIIGLSLLGINLLILRGIDTSLESSLKKLPAVEKLQSGKISPFLPDINGKQKLSESKLRNTEVNKIKNKLPYIDKKHNITIDYGPKTTLIVAGITHAKNINDYREKKFLLEQQLHVLGAENLCNLALLWAPPFELKKDLQPEDVRTSGCSF